MRLGLTEGGRDSTSMTKQGPGNSLLNRAIDNQNQ